MPDPTDPYPLWSFQFSVEDMEIGTFQGVSGLSVEVEFEPIEEGGENGFTHKFPGRMSWPNIVLKRGITQSDNLFAWLAESTAFTAKGKKLTRRGATITLLTVEQEPKPVRYWNVVDAFAVKWTGPQFDATSTDAATEELEIAHHGFTPGNA